MSNASTLQTLVDWANGGVVISLALSFIFGAASVYLSKRLGIVKDAEAATAQQKLELALATQQERAAKAESDLLKLQEQSKPRRASAQFVESLKGKPAGAVTMQYDPRSWDAYELGSEIAGWLLGEGWKLGRDDLTPLPHPEPRGGVDAGINPEGAPYRYGLRLETPVIENCDAGTETPFCTLSNALKVSGLDFGSTGRDDTLPKDTFRIIIGRRPPLRIE